MTASILSNGRHHGAFGMAGGLPGQVGRNSVERADGSVERLDHIGSAQMRPGDVFVVETPGAGVSVRRLPEAFPGDAESRRREGRQVLHGSIP